ncbi:DCN1-like protein 5 [Tripterygium wilfordii]|uniref:DCN1-like protein 5 n=1 Tax=Tripterygium wilfordii TaxID=458696 RepID=UPI0018F818C1|nr:DCN1-like protein 5 [Tripterygium wilfordii]
MRRKSVPRRSHLGDMLPDSPPAKTRRRTVEGIDNLFDSYANSTSGLIDPEGIEALCLDIGVDLTDVRMLVLAWIMNAEKQGYFSRDEWRRGLRTLRVDTLEKLQEAVSQLGVEFAAGFEDFYSYAFNFNLTEEWQRTVDIDSICKLLALVLQPRFPDPVDLLIQYLKIQSEYKAITRDQWINFLQFFNEVDFPGLDNYVTNAAWPVILDKFAEWMSKGKKL